MHLAGKHVRLFHLKNLFPLTGLAVLNRILA
jgi:hypothetical protein